MSPAGARRVEAVILATIILFGLLSVVSFRALLPLAAISTAALVWLLRGQPLLRETARSPTLWALGGVLLAGAASWTVSIDPALTSAKILQLALIFGVGMLMIAAFRQGAAFVDPRRLRLACFVSVGLMIAGILIVTFFPGPFLAAGVPEKYFFGPDHLQNRPSFLLAVWVFVAALAFRRHAWLAPLAAFATLYLVYAQDDAPLAPVIAMVAGFAAVLLAMAIARWAIALIGATMVVTLIAILPIMHDHGEDLLKAAENERQQRSTVSRLIGDRSGVHRLEIWSSVADRAVERVWLGWGLDASRRVPATRDSYGGRARATIDLHPHNSFLQIWLEMGLAGALAAGLAVAAIARGACAIADDKPVAVALSGAIAATVLIFSVGFGVFQSWWIGGLFLIAAFAALAQASRRKARAASP